MVTETRAGQHARGDGGPPFGRRQSQEITQAQQFRALFRRQNEPEARLGKLLLQLLVFFAHADKIKITAPRVVSGVAHGQYGLEHGSRGLKPDESGEVVQHMCALIPAVHAEIQQKKQGGEQQKTLGRHGNSKPGEAPGRLRTGRPVRRS